MPSGMFQFIFYSVSPCCVFNPPIGYWEKKANTIYQLNGELNDHEQYCYQSQFQQFILGKKDTFETINFHFNDLNQKLLFEKDTYETINHHFCKLVKKLKNDGYDDEYRKRKSYF